MATLTIVQFPEEPVAFDIDAQKVAADVAGDEFASNGSTGFWIENLSGGPIAVTFVHQANCNQGQTHDAVVSVPDAFVGFISSRFLAQRFNAANGRIQVTYDDVTNVSVAAVRLDG